MLQPIRRSEPVHSGPSLGFRATLLWQQRSSRSLARVCASWSHTRRSPGTLWYAFTDCTAALCCLHPPPKPAPARVLDTSSVLRYTLCLFARCSSRFDSRLRATIALPFLHESRRPSVEGKFAFSATQLCVSYCTRDVFEGGVNKAGWKAGDVADGRFSGPDDPANYLGTNDGVACPASRRCSGVLRAPAS